MTEAFYEVRNIQTVRDIIDSSAELFADRPAFEIKKKDRHYEITYNEYRNDINALSSAFLLDGDFDGKRVAICADNCYEYCLTYLSVICSGGVIVPVDKELFPEDILGILNASEASLIFCDRKHYRKISEILPSGMTAVCFGAEEDDSGAVPFYEFIGRGRKEVAEGRELWKNVTHDVNRMCTLLFTSGTTGVSKGVMLCQRNFVFEIKAAMGVIKINPEDCGISLLPLHHTFESSIIIFFAPYCGAKVTFCDGFKYVLKNMKEFNPSVFVAVPLVLETVHTRILRKVREKKFGELKFRVGKSLCKAAGRFNIGLKKVLFKEIQETFGGNMRLIICGGAPINPQIIKDFDAFGIQVVFGYGLTECAPLAIINHDRLRSTDSIGEPLPGVEAKIISADENGVGEICVKGDMVMLGYYNNPEATAEVLDADGFLHTGDLGFVDGKGHYHTCGRCKNVIVTPNGKNIYPEELEYHLDSDRFVNSSLVQAKKNERGEDKTIHAQLYPELEEIRIELGREPTEDEIRGYMKRAVDAANERLPSFKRIASFTVRKKDFVRTTAQKIKRNNN